jgi:hypothetical protein
VHRALEPLLELRQHLCSRVGDGDCHSASSVTCPAEGDGAPSARLARGQKRDRFVFRPQHVHLVLAREGLGQRRGGHDAPDGQYLAEPPSAAGLLTERCRELFRAHHACILQQLADARPPAVDVDVSCANGRWDARSRTPAAAPNAGRRRPDPAAVMFARPPLDR